MIKLHSYWPYWSLSLPSLAGVFFCMLIHNLNSRCVQFQFRWFCVGSGTASHSVGSFHNDLHVGCINLQALIEVPGKQWDCGHDFCSSIDAENDVQMIYDCCTGKWNFDCVSGVGNKNEVMFWNESHFYLEERLLCVTASFNGHTQSTAATLCWRKRSVDGVRSSFGDKIWNQKNIFLQKWWCIWMIL